MNVLECQYDPNATGLFVWGKTPKTFKDAYELSDQLLYQSGVFITPGGIFGSQGEQYIRISLCSPISEMEAALNKIKGNKKLKN